MILTSFALNHGAVAYMAYVGGLGPGLASFLAVQSAVALAAALALLLWRS